jgi:hypothetical protein
MYGPICDVIFFSGVFILTACTKFWLEVGCGYRAPSAHKKKKRERKQFWVSIESLASTCFWSRTTDPMVGENRRLVHYQPMDFPSWSVQISNHRMAIRLLFQSSGN